MNDTLNPSGGLTSVALLELAAGRLAIVVSGCKPVHVLEVTVARGTTLLTSVGATVELRGKPNREGKEEEGDHSQEGVQLDPRVQLEVRHVDPLVVAGLDILRDPGGRPRERLPWSRDSKTLFKRQLKGLHYHSPCVQGLSFGKVQKETG